VQLKPAGKLFEFIHSAPFYVSWAINQAILSFSPPDYQAAVTRGEAALPTITPTDLRHNVGHSLAMQGISAGEGTYKQCQRFAAARTENAVGPADG